MIERNTDVQVFTGGKRYTGGMSSVGHSWTLAGVKTYKSIRKILVSDMKEYINIHFNCKKRREVWFNRNCKQSRQRGVSGNVI